MKNKAVSGPPKEGASAGIVTAISVAVGFWVLQILAMYFVSGAAMRRASVMAGAICFAGFATFFILHLLNPWSKAAALLGLGSFCVFTISVAYLRAPHPGHYTPLTRSALIISAVLGLAGIALDIERCWRLCSLSLSQSAWLKLGHKVLAMFRHAFHRNHL